MTRIGNNGRGRHSARAAGIGAAFVAATVAVAGCGINMQELPLPGGTDTGSKPRQYTIQFDNVLDLVPQSQVKKDGINVGRIVSIKVPKVTRANASISRRCSPSERPMRISMSAAPAASCRRCAKRPLTGPKKHCTPNTSPRPMALPLPPLARPSL